MVLQNAFIALRIAFPLPLPSYICHASVSMRSSHAVTKAPACSPCLKTAVESRLNEACHLPLPLPPMKMPILLPSKNSHAVPSSAGNNLETFYHRCGLSLPLLCGLRRRRQVVDALELPGPAEVVQELAVVEAVVVRGVVLLRYCKRAASIGDNGQST